MPRGLISELEKAAGNLDQLTARDVSVLLDRSIAMVRELRKTAVTVAPIGRDVVIYLKATSEAAANLPDDQKRDALLDAAEAIRLLLESGAKP
ncbi:hypothetical protein YA62_004495 [Agrobacterium sp. LC34]|uniref:hypothetical protein n=1 Tax=unclassified Agrobacterium TaxID=2632611 RepID=UPI00062A3C25|nr:MULTISPECIES: hypothetical protein [unclassified Agrobacterium]KNY33198.1 hypothetical protein AKG12_15600 [Agrobacterium sp. SUL3]TKT68028.1 hypothetical protein YA62_004495 [Agrobacterium sp. LC34]